MKRKALICAVFQLTVGGCLVTAAQSNTFPSSGNVGIGTTNPANSNATVELSWLKTVYRNH